MDFERTDPDENLERLRANRRLFGDAIAALVSHENFDNRLPSGLRSLVPFFDLHRKAIHGGTVSPDALYEAFVAWMRKGRAD